MNKQSTVITEKKLYRSENDRVFGGVAGGIGEYFNVDPAIVRLLFVLATFFGGSGIPIYIIMWIILPSEKGGAIASEETVKQNVSEIKDKALHVTGRFRGESRTGRGRLIIASVLIGFGTLALLDNLKIFRADIFWPLILVLIGLLMLRR